MWSLWIFKTSLKTSVTKAKTSFTHDVLENTYFVLRKSKLQRNSSSTLYGKYSFIKKMEFNYNKAFFSYSMKCVNLQTEKSALDANLATWHDYNKGCKCKAISLIDCATLFKNWSIIDGYQILNLLFFFTKAALWWAIFKTLLQP